jgi:hypothetical protein
MNGHEWLSGHHVDLRSVCMRKRWGLFNKQASWPSFMREGAKRNRTRTHELPLCGT